MACGLVKFACNARIAFPLYESEYYLYATRSDTKLDARRGRPRVTQGEFAKGASPDDLLTGHQDSFPMALLNKLREFDSVPERITTRATGNLDGTHARWTLA